MKMLFHFTLSTIHNSLSKWLKEVKKMFGG